jgi:hypothetical protein
LFYASPDGKIISVEMNAGQPGPAKPLLEAPALAPSASTAWDVSPDGTRFVFAVPRSGGARAPFTVVLTWQAGLKKPAGF